MGLRKKGKETEMFTVLLCSPDLRYIPAFLNLVLWKSLAGRSFSGPTLLLVDETAHPNCSHCKNTPLCLRVRHCGNGHDRDVPALALREVIVLSMRVCVCACVRSRVLSHVQLFATLWTIAHHAPLPLGFCRQEYWSGFPFPAPGDLPDPGVEPASLTTPTSGSLPLAPPGIGDNSVILGPETTC